MLAAMRTVSSVTRVYPTRKPAAGQLRADYRFRRRRQQAASPVTHKSIDVGSGTGDVGGVEGSSCGLSVNVSGANGWMGSVSSTNGSLIAAMAMLARSTPVARACMMYSAVMGVPFGTSPRSRWKLDRGAVSANVHATA